MFKSFTFSVLLGLVAIGGSVKADIFFFGDSLSDSGNLFLATSGTPPAPYFEGRFSNGPTWAENFAQRMGASATPSLAGGTNYAFGGARTGTGTVPINLLDQITAYETSGSPGGSDDLFVIWAGSNDIFDAAVATNPADVVNAALFNISSAISSLESSGAENFIVLNSTPLGQTPFYQPLGAATIGFLNSLSMNFNDGLSAELSALETSLGVEINEIDMFSLMLAIQSDPASYGLANATDSATPFSDTTGLSTGLPTVDPETYLFWDGIHPTAAGHRLIANHVFVNAVPEPSGIVITMLVGVACSLRRRRA